MKLLDDGDGYVLTTGRKFYANSGIVGIDPQLNVHEGYDGYVWTGYSHEDDAWSKVEREELAEYMIALWRGFAEQEIEP